MVHNIEGEAGRMTVRTLACVCKFTFFFSKWSRIFSLVSSITEMAMSDDGFVVVHHSSPGICSPWQPCGGQTESRTAAESFKIEINPLARHKWEDNIIITPQVSCFCFSICLLSFHQAVAIWCIVYVYVRVSMFWCVCTHEREQV